MEKRQRIIVDVSNLTIHPTDWVRTGIQETVYRVLLALLEVRSEFPEFEVILLPQLPRRTGGLFSSSTILPYPNTQRSILEKIERDAGLSSQEVWGFDLAAHDYRLSDKWIFEFLSQADVIYFQALANIGPLVEKIRAKLGLNRGPKIGMTLYDLVPALFPEYCDDEIARWYQIEYLPSLVRYADTIVAISRNTGLDLLSHSLGSMLRQVMVLPLPLDPVQVEPGQEERAAGLMSRFGLQVGEYILVLGTLEPRKNFEGLFGGFEAHQKLYPDSRLKLVVAGASGWKNAAIEGMIADSPCAGSIVRTGYLDDSEVDPLIRGALALAMLSHYEGYGLPVAQAFVRGTAVITTLGSSLPEACGGQGIFVDPVDPFSVSAGIRLARAARGESKKNSGLHRTFEGRTWSNYARETLKVLLPTRRCGIEKSQVC